RGLDWPGAAGCESGEPAKETGVGGRVGAEGEDAGAACQGGERRENLVLVRHLTVGDQDQETIPDTGTTCVGRAGIGLGGAGRTWVARGVVGQAADGRAWVARGAARRDAGGRGGGAGWGGGGG